MKSNKTTPAKHEIKQNNTCKTVQNTYVKKSNKATPVKHVKHKTRNQTKQHQQNMKSNKTTPVKHEIKQNNTSEI